MVAWQAGQSKNALGEIYHKIKQRNGIYKIHIDANNILVERSKACLDRALNIMFEGTADMRKCHIR